VEPTRPNASRDATPSLEGRGDSVRELLRAEEVKWLLAVEAGYTVSLLPVSTEDYERSGEPFLWNARREGDTRGLGE